MQQRVLLQPAPAGLDGWATLHVGGILPPAFASDSEALDFDVGEGELAQVDVWVYRSLDREVTARLEVAKIAREAEAPLVAGTTDSAAEGKEPICFGTRTQVVVASTPQ
jgi:hypothetical protein